MCWDASTALVLVHGCVHQTLHTRSWAGVCISSAFGQRLTSRSLGWRAYFSYPIKHLQGARDMGALSVRIWQHAGIPRDLGCGVQLLYSTRIAFAAAKPSILFRMCFAFAVCLCMCRSLFLISEVRGGCNMRYAWCRACSTRAFTQLCAVCNSHRLRD